MQSLTDLRSWLEKKTTYLIRPVCESSDYQIREYIHKAQSSETGKLKIVNSFIMNLVIGKHTYTPLRKTQYIHIILHKG